ncbi:LysR family transcriptional regulator [Solilutibacter silvestris]|nr:LysR family transcriptional regulator [Lysobacter silvestris]
MATFVAVVEAGSLTAAATRLNTTKSVVSRRLVDLETELGAILLERGTRGARATEVGAVYYAKCVRILEAIHSSSEFVSGFNDIVAGTLKVAMARSFHEASIAAVLNRFAAQYPDIVLQVETPESGRLDDGDFDVALQPGEPSGPDLIARTLFEFANVLCASPDYLQRRGMPRMPAEMADHDALVDGDGKAIGWSHREHGQWLPLRTREHLRSSDRRQLVSAVREGLGILLAPESVVAEDLSAGRLQRVLADAELPPGRISILYPRSRRTSRKVQLLLAFLREAFPADEAMIADPD